MYMMPLELLKIYPRAFLVVAPSTTGTQRESALVLETVGRVLIFICAVAEPTVKKVSSTKNSFFIMR
jgi:hypothetical protein